MRSPFDLTLMNFKFKCDTLEEVPGDDAVVDIERGPVGRNFDSEKLRYTGVSVMNWHDRLEYCTDWYFEVSRGNLWCRKALGDIEATGEILEISSGWEKFSIMELDSIRRACGANPGRYESLRPIYQIAMYVMAEWLPKNWIRDNRIGPNLGGKMT